MTPKKRKKHQCCLIVTALLVCAAITAWQFISRNLTVYAVPETAFKHSLPQLFHKSLISPRWQCYENRTVPPNRSQAFRLLSWNIHKGEDEGWQQTLLEAAKGKQFVLLQEATTLQRISLQLPRFNSYLHSFAFRFRWQKSGVMSLSTLNADRYCSNGLTEPLLRLPKIMTALRFPLEKGGSLLVINVHLINFEWGTDSYRKQLDTLKELVEHHQGAVIVAGDFNAWNGRRKSNLAAMMKSVDLRETPIIPDERITAFGYPLDYIFTRGIKLHSAAAFKVESSDHNPLELNFSLE